MCWIFCFTVGYDFNLFLTASTFLREFQGVNHVQEDFMLAAVDIVADPSAPGAFVNGIMEGKEWVWNNGIMQEVQISNYKNFSF